MPLLSTAKCALMSPTLSCFFIASWTPAMANSATLASTMPGGRSSGSAWYTVNFASSVAFATETILRTGNLLYRGSSVLRSCSGPLPRSTSSAYGAASAAPNLRMRKVVDMFAAKRPAPIATASSASR